MYSYILAGCVVLVGCARFLLLFLLLFMLIEFLCVFGRGREGEGKRYRRPAQPTSHKRKEAIGSEGAKEGEGGQRGEMREKEKAFVM